MVAGDDPPCTGKRLPHWGPAAPRGLKGALATATIRANGEDVVIVSVIAFGNKAERLLQFMKGDAIAVSGRAKLTSWNGRDGTEKHGISLAASVSSRA